MGRNLESHVEDTLRPGWGQGVGFEVPWYPLHPHHEAERRSVGSQPLIRLGALQDPRKKGDLESDGVKGLIRDC